LPAAMGRTKGRLRNQVENRQEGEKRSEGKIPFWGAGKPPENKNRQRQNLLNRVIVEERWGRGNQFFWARKQARPRPLRRSFYKYE